MSVFKIEDIQDEITSLLKEIMEKHEHIQLQDNNDLEPDNQPLLSNIIFIPDEQCQRVLKKLDPDLELSYLGSAESSDIGMIDNSKLIAYDNDNNKISYFTKNEIVGNLVRRIIAALSDTSLEMRDKYVSENYVLEDSLNNNLDADSVTNDISRRK